MRTTLTVDDALLRQLRQKALDSGKPFKQVVNEALRAGLNTPAVASSSKARQAKSLERAAGTPSIFQAN